MSHHLDNIFAGTQVVSLVEVRGTNNSFVHPLGEVGVVTLRDAGVSVSVEAHRDRLFAVKRGELPWAEEDAWRKELHRDFECVLAETKLPERPD